MISYRNKTDYELHSKNGPTHLFVFNTAAILMSLAFVVMVMMEEIF